MPRGRPRGSQNKRSNSRILRNYEAFLDGLRKDDALSLPVKCSRCGGPMISGYDDATCLYCGEYACRKTGYDDTDDDEEWPPVGERVNYAAG